MDSRSAGPAIAFVGGIILMMPEIFYPSGSLGQIAVSGVPLGWVFLALASLFVLTGVSLIFKRF